METLYNTCTFALMKNRYTKVFCSTSLLSRVMDRLDIPQISRREFLDFLQDEGKVRLDDYIEGAVEVAEEVHSGLMMEDDERILNLHESKSYGFEAYLTYRFGSRIQDIASELKIRPLENYAGTTDKERQLERFLEYCDILRDAEYDVKAIKLADRLNNMLFILKVTGHDKIRRYMREAEDFYIAYTMLPPKMPHFYQSIRAAYEKLRILSTKKLVAA